MSSDALKKALAVLHRELSGAPKLDEQARERVRQLVRDAENLQPSARAAAPTEERHRLEALAVEFEAEHPDLAASLRQLMDLLVKAGM